jgi:hypothetical protein
MGVRAIGSTPEIEPLGLAICRRSGSKIMENDAGRTEGDVPVIGLMEVIVQAHDCSGLTVATIALDHLAPLWEPLASIGLDEESALVTMNVGIDDVDAVDLV